MANVMFGAAPLVASCGMFIKLLSVTRMIASLIGVPQGVEEMWGGCWEYTL